MFFRYFIVAVPAVGVAEQQHAELLSAALHVLQKLYNCCACCIGVAEQQHAVLLYAALHVLQKFYSCCACCRCG